MERLWFVEFLENDVVFENGWFDDEELEKEFEENEYHVRILEVLVVGKDDYCVRDLWNLVMIREW